VYDGNAPHLGALLVHHSKANGRWEWKARGQDLMPMQCTPLPRAVQGGPPPLLLWRVMRAQEARGSEKEEYKAFGSMAVGLGIIHSPKMVVRSKNS